MFRLEQHIGTSMATGKTIELKQWRIFYGDVLVGYLPQTQHSQIQALFHFPHQELNQTVLDDFALENAAKLNIDDCKVDGPEQYSRQFVEEAFAIKAAEDAENE